MAAVDSGFDHLFHSIESYCDKDHLQTHGINTIIPLLCLLGMGLWALMLVTAVMSTRVFAVVSGKRKSNDFPSGSKHGAEWYWRLNRAHLNTAENLPIFGSIVISGILLGAASPLFSKLAIVYLLARIGQSTAHISGGSVAVVNVRFSFMVTQTICAYAMVFVVLSSVIHGN